jgi:hypothetical protein
VQDLNLEATGAENVKQKEKQGQHKKGQHKNEKGSKKWLKRQHKKDGKEMKRERVLVGCCDD